MQHDKVGHGERALLALLGALTGVSAVLLIGQAIGMAPIRLPGVTIDRLSAVMTLLVAGVGIVAYRFSLRYLDGEPGQRRFLRWLALTVGTAYLLMLSTNLVLLMAAWSFTSFGLHQLLTFYHNRPEAVPPARKKFLISRLGDVALLSAIGLIWLEWGTLDLHSLVSRVSTGSPSELAAALLVVVAALTKSAQFPFHSWLPETMEAPTPVSALMHAGIINAGGVLLLRFAPLLAAVPEALFMLAFVGTLTASLGMLALWAQTNVKRTLAWSTVSQMGFMMVQLGLAAFPAAALHIVGHGCYKAWSFLRSGDLPRQARYTALAPGRALVLSAAGTLAAVPALALSAMVTGFDPLHSPGELALTAIVALAIGQLWVALFKAPLSARGGLIRGAGAACATFGAALLAFALYQGAAAFLAPALGPIAVQAGPLAWGAAILPVAAFTGLAVVHAFLPVLGRSASGRALYIHALNGFYFGAIADRLVQKIWSSFAGRGADHA